MDYVFFAFTFFDVYLLIFQKPSFSLHELILSQEGNDPLSTQSSTLPSPHISQSLLILADVVNSRFFFI